MQPTGTDGSGNVTAPVPKWPDWIVIGLTLLPLVPTAAIFASHNVSWLNHAIGGFAWWSVVAGVLGGLLGGITLAYQRRNPLWLIASVTSLCIGFFWLLFAMAVGMASMH